MYLVIATSARRTTMEFPPHHHRHHGPKRHDYGLWMVLLLLLGGLITVAVVIPLIPHDYPKKPLETPEPLRTTTTIQGRLETPFPVKMKGGRVVKKG